MNVILQVKKASIPVPEGHVPKAEARYSERSVYAMLDDFALQRSLWILLSLHFVLFIFLIGSISTEYVFLLLHFGHIVLYIKYFGLFADFPFYSYYTESHKTEFV